MKVAIDLPGAGVDTRDRAEFEDSIAFVLEAEKLGVDSVWVAEAWGMDCVVRSLSTTWAAGGRSRHGRALHHGHRWAHRGVAQGLSR